MNFITGSNAYLQKAAVGKNTFWRYLLTLMLVTVLTFSAQAVLLLLAIFRTGTFDLNRMPPILYLTVVMLPFGAIVIGLWVGVRYIHRRSFKSLLTAARRFRWSKLLLSAGIWFGLFVLSDLLLTTLSPGTVAWTFDARRFFPYMLVALVLVPIQVSGEELMFRGYLTQALGQMSKGLLVPLLVPAVLFGLLHAFNPEVSAYGMAVMMAYYIGMGLFLGGITLYSRGLELSLGVHLATNLYATLVMTFPNSAIPSPALFTSQVFDPMSSLIVFVVMAVIYLLLVVGVRGRLSVQSAGSQETAD